MINNAEFNRVYHDAQNLMTALSAAINAEENFVNQAKDVIARFGNTDHSSTACRTAVYAATDRATDNYDELLMMLASSEKRIRTLQQGANFINGWKEDLK